MKRWFFVIAALMVLSLPGFGQDAAKAISGGVLNGKAVYLPKPEYPAEARDEKAEGPVSVDIVIDEQGNVVSAISQPYAEVMLKSNAGIAAERREIHPALRRAAETAALGARFAPTRLNGVPVRVKGRIIYNFAVSSNGFSDGKTISGGVLNGKARSLPLPACPPAAKAVKASGAVNVQVVISEEGEVIAATAVSGHPLLRSAAVDAARGAKFSPTLLGGTPIKVTGVLIYNFAAEDGPEN